MGTNYYAVSEDETLHIGKSSAGWCFSLHVIPEKGITSLCQWKDTLSNGKYKIVDEYEQSSTLNEILEVITERSHCVPHDKKPVYKDSYYGCEERFHEVNHSERGPNNLLRHKVDGVNCVGHGEGTWDYIVVEFS